MMESTEGFVPDREMLRRGLDVLDGMVKTLEEGERIEIADAAALLGFLRPFEADGRALAARVEDALKSRRCTDFVRDLRRLGMTLRNCAGQTDGVGLKKEIQSELSARLSRLERKFVRAGGHASSYA